MLIKNFIFQKLKLRFTILLLIGLLFSLSPISVEAADYYCPNGGVLNTTNNTCVITSASCPANWTDIGGSQCSQPATLVCSFISPAGGFIDISLGDAELRSDQDFTCNYTAKICFTVFQDIDNDGLYTDGLDSIIDGVDVNLMTGDGINQIYSQTSSSLGNPCFEPLASTDYKLIVPTPPTPFSTTGGDEINYNIDYTSGVIEAFFGYSNGTISLTVDETTALDALEVSSLDQNSCGDINSIEVIDTRIDGNGWDVTAVVSDFFNLSNPAQIIEVSNQFTGTPGTVNIISGPGTNRFPGQQKTVSSISDPISVMSALPDSDQGTTLSSMGICQLVPSFNPIGNYQSTVTFTVF